MTNKELVKDRPEQPPPPRPAKQRLVAAMAQRFGVDAGKFLATLKATAFRQKEGVDISDEQMMALLVVANEYKLNPFTKEIFAFPDKQNGIVPVVGVDGWLRIINDHSQMDGIEFRYSETIVVDPSTNEKKPKHKPCPEWCEAIIARKDRSNPTVVREDFDEVYREPFQDRNKKYWIGGPWQSHTKRMLRHKALIQAARVAFGFSGIYDEDEANNIIEGAIVDAPAPAEQKAIAMQEAALGTKNPEQEPEPEQATEPEQTADEAEAKADDKAQDAATKDPTGGFFDDAPPLES